MLVQFFIQVIITLLEIVFSWMPDVTTLPTIGGYDIDAALVTGVGSFKEYITVVWPIAVVFEGLMFLLGYYFLKMILKFFFGQRAPGAH